MEFNVMPLNEAEKIIRQRQKQCNRLGWQAIRNYAVIIPVTVLAVLASHDFTLIWAGIFLIIGTLISTFIQLHLLEKSDDDG